MNVKFSIIIPVYNVEDYIKRCVRSVQSQIFKNFEIILIDDGSIDNSGLICDQLAELDNRIRVYHQANCGVSTARNVGIENARGEYITFIDADDYWTRPSVLDEPVFADTDIIYMLKIFREYPNGRKVLMNKKYFSPDDVVEDNVLEIFSHKLVCGSWGCVYLFVKNELIKENNIFFDPFIQLGEDMDWFFRVCEKAKKARFIHEPYYCYYVNRKNSAMTKKSVESIISLMYLVRKLEQAKKNNPRFSMVYISACNNAVSYLPTFGNYNDDERKELVNEFLACHALKNAQGKNQYKIKKLIYCIGIDRYITFTNIIYKIRVFGSKIKSKIIF